jgi:ABC-2 type transport system ATP-binding protein
MKNILEVKDINKKIKNHQILNEISFNVKENSIFGIVGLNGAGKSTLLKIITGLVKADKGSVKINGYDLNENFEKAIERVGCILDGMNMYENMTALENLELFKRMFKGVDENKVKEIVRLVNLEKHIGKKVKTFSLGMKQRLNLAQALLNNPKLLILDEPTNGLDPYGIIELREFLKNLNDVTIIISSHLLNEIENICDEVLILKEGKIEEIIKLSTPKNIKRCVKFEVNELLKAKKLLKLKIDDDLVFNLNRKETGKLNKYLVKNNINVFRIEETKGKLENKFMENIDDK